MGLTIRNIPAWPLRHTLSESSVHTRNTPDLALWTVLTDFESYPEWNPALEIEGEAEEGERLQVTTDYENTRPMTFRPTVLVVNEQTELGWQGRLFGPGLYDREHRFVLTALDGGERTTNTC